MRMNRFVLAGLLIGHLVMAGCSSNPKDDSDGAFVQPVETQTEVTEPPAQTYGADSGNSVEQDSQEAAELARQQALLSTKVFYFEFDSATIKASAYDALKAHAAHLAKHPNVTVRLEGHADERGTREYNMALAEHRAKAIAKFLRLNGVASSQLNLVSFGEEKPADYGHNERAWSKNRRVEIKY